MVIELAEYIKQVHKAFNSVMYIGNQTQSGFKEE